MSSLGGHSLDVKKNTHHFLGEKTSQTPKWWRDLLGRWFVWKSKQKKLPPKPPATNPAELLFVSKLGKIFGDFGEILFFANATQALFSIFLQIECSHETAI